MILDPGTMCDLDADDYLGKEFECKCGKKHSAGIEKVVIENGALQRIPGMLRDFNCRRVLVVADSNTYEAAGRSVEQLLEDHGFAHSALVFARDESLVPDERAIGEFLVGIDGDTDLILAVGSGVINDLAKYIGTRLNVPMIIVATAPSMDGYASDSSALTLDNLKTSVMVHTPKAIIADIDVLKQAPMDMILAGLGDMLGKYSALKDWKLGNIITGEYYCDSVEQMVRVSVQKCVDSIEGLSSRDDSAIKSLMEGLVISGIAMSFVGNSRPASGSEHHISHYWETAFLQQGRKAVLHGAKVGIAVLATSQITEALASKKIDFDAARKAATSFDEHKWQENVERLYQKAAPGIIKQSRDLNRNSLEERLERIDAIERNWDRVLQVLTEEPSARVVMNLLEAAGAPTNPRDVGIDSDMVYNSIIYAKEIRSRYTVLQLLWDLGLIEEFAAGVVDYYGCCTAADAR